MHAKQEVERLTRMYMRRPVVVTVSSSSVAVDSILERVSMVEDIEEPPLPEPLDHVRLSVDPAADHDFA
jgi:hypothetical protein